ncbi:MAG TPA: phospho-sugar mutase [Propionibacteriaceae bacterium]|nr:phospho-sugar mutase [Propionibacteriaceae bacterium]
MKVRAPAISGDLVRAIASWTEQDPDPQTRQQLDELAKAANSGDARAMAELADAFSARLQFGTAGLRGALGPGPNRMNRVVVGQTAAALASHLLDHGLAGGGVIIGFDARHKSDIFARDTAEIMSGAGFQTMITSGPLPTPLVPFGIRHFGCVAGVVVTASHNPPQDNGYKVYLGDGSQIVPPADAEISAWIDQVAQHSLDDIPRSPSYTVLGEELLSAYLDRVAGLVRPDAPRQVRWVYTPLHGVGASLVERAVSACGFPSPHVVAEQANPDPRFPTVAFPNPEEPGAIDLALAQAQEIGADLVIANDPDADRCAIAVIVDGEWRMLSGDELGVLLGEDALRRCVRGTYACSIVSSSLLSAMATAYRQPFVYTLTGFKWIGRVPGLAYGYEEAIGYCVDPEAVPDKDGVSALIMVLTLAAGLKAEGLSLADRLDEIARRYGIYQTEQVSVRVPDPKIITSAMDRLRARPPRILAGHLTSVHDLAHGSQELPPTNAVLITGEMIKVVVRPSGTEPKLKCYLEVHLGTTSSADIPATRAQARSILATIRSEMSAVLGL